MAFVDENTGAEAYNWETDGVYLIEELDPVQGGVGGIANAQALALAKRTRNLHARLLLIVQSITNLIGGADEAYNTLGKIQDAIEALDFDQVNLEELKAELRGGVDASLDTMKKIVDYVNALEISFNDLSDLPEFQGRAELSGSAIDWLGKPERFKVLSADTELSATNLIVGKTIGLLLTGNFTTTFTSAFEKVPGSPAVVAGSKNYVQMKCIDNSTGSEKIIYSVMQLQS
jgi:dihydrodipicolinate synthase/N-acetylneuraminate lyase